MYYGNSFNCGRIRTGRAVLVAISIPIFSNQLEKSRDAVSVSNIRAAYAQAQTAYLTESSDTTNKVTYTPANTSTSATVKVEGVVIKSKSANNWSGEAAELPFYDKISDTTNHGDSAQSSSDITFTYDANGAITSVTFS